MSHVKMLRLWLGLVLIALLNTAAIAAPAAWSDPHTGLAIGGYDPLAYWTNGHATQGQSDLELFWSGTTWRFSNQGNLAAFKRDPQIYAPKYAGYDVVSLAKGKLTPGLPSLWVIFKDELYLFRSQKNLVEWRMHSERLKSKVEKVWPKLSKERHDFAADPPLKDLYPELSR